MSLGPTLRGAAMRAIAKSVRVDAVEAMSRRVLRVRLSGEVLEGMAFEPGQKIKIHVGGGEMRSYTPASLDPNTGKMDVVVYVHGESAACVWARSLATGETVSFMGPGTSLLGTADDVPWAAFYGDETTIGLAEAIVRALPDGTLVFGAIEVHADDVGAVADLPFDAAPRTKVYGEALVAHLGVVDVPAGPGVVWLSGEAGSVLALRTALLGRGLMREQLRIKPYWSLRGKAHRKELERTVLRS